MATRTRSTALARPTTTRPTASTRRTPARCTSRAPAATSASRPATEGLLVGLAVPGVAPGVLLHRVDLLLADVLDRLARNADDQRPGRKGLAFGDERVGADDGFAPDDGS